MTVRDAGRWLAAEDCLDLLPEAWKQRLADASQFERLSIAARALPPIPRLGLEVRLGPTSGRIDLHQLVAADAHEPVLLLDHFERDLEGGLESAPLKRFLGLWADPSGGLGAVFPYLYLEFDQPESASDARFPCVFLDVHRRLGVGEQRRQREGLTIELVSEVLAAAGRSVPPGFATCLEAVPPTASIGHLGLMFGREQGWLRVNIKQLGRGMLLPLLEALGWPGDRAAADALFAHLLDHADRVTVALDLRGDWQSGIGFELFFEHPPERDPRWKQVLAWLCDQGLATPDEQAALLAFPAVIEPGLDAGNWPARWIVAAAIAPPDHVPRFTRYLSHLKISIDASGARQAKAYLGMIHEWQVLAVPRIVDVEAHSGPRGGSVDAAIRAGFDFLAGRVSQGGFWHDFQLRIGFGDEWVTAFIACQLLDAGVPEAEVLARRALDWLLRRQRPAGGWGFNGTAPPDADSTAWVLRLAAQLGSDATGIVAAHRFLALHLLACGGVTTYAADTPLHLDGAALDDSRREGWSGAHACVTANAARFMPAASTEWLRRQQSAEGAWHAYWWSTDLLATALAAECLHLARSPDDAARIGHAADWAWNNGGGEAAFDKAWQLRLGLLAPDRVPRDRLSAAVGRLLAEQHADGAWPAGAPMLFHQPWESGRAPNKALCLDQNRCFTTAAVIGALGLAERARISGAWR